MTSIDLFHPCRTAFTHFIYGKECWDRIKNNIEIPYFLSIHCAKMKSQLHLHLCMYELSIYWMYTCIVCSISEWKVVLFIFYFFSILLGIFSISHSLTHLVRIKRHNKLIKISFICRCTQMNIDLYCVVGFVFDLCTIIEPRNTDIFERKSISLSLSPILFLNVSIVKWNIHK